jgi:hypothetical protein
MIKQNPSYYDPGQIPPALNNWADVTFLQWYQAAKDPGGSNNAVLKRARTLRYFAKFHIINKESQGIIDHMSTLASVPIDSKMDTTGFAVVAT